MFSWFSRPKPISKLFILHDGKKQALTFESQDYIDQQIPLGHLKSKLAPLLDVPANCLSIYQMDPKRKLNNDQNTLSHYNVKNGETLLIVGQKPKPLTVGEQIDAAVNKVDEDLGDRIKVFCANPPTNERAREKEFLVLNEVILQNILKLDVIELGSDPSLRQKRKDAINKLQKLHTEIDQANKKSLQLIAENDNANANAADAKDPSPQPDSSKESSPKPQGQKKKKSKGKGKKR